MSVNETLTMIGLMAHLLPSIDLVKSMYFTFFLINDDQTLSLLLNL